MGFYATQNALNGNVFFVVAVVGSPLSDSGDKTEKENHDLHLTSTNVFHNNP